MISYSPGTSLAVSFTVKPGAMFSRSSTTISTLEGISHSITRIALVGDGEDRAALGAVELIGLAGRGFYSYCEGTRGVSRLGSVGGLLVRGEKIGAGLPGAATIIVQHPGAKERVVDTWSTHDSAPLGFGAVLEAGACQEQDESRDPGRKDSR